MSRPAQFTCVDIGGRGLLISGKSGSGKSSLALALIDRGAVLVGDDGVLLSQDQGRLVAAPHPNISGKLEVRNLGLLDFAVSPAVPVALAVVLDPHAPRFLEEPEAVVIEGVTLPQVRLWPNSPVLALKAELAFARFGVS